MTTPLKDRPATDLFRLVLSSFGMSTMFLPYIKDAAGLQLYLDIEQYVADCLAAIGLPLDTTDDKSHRPHPNVAEDLHCKLLYALSGLHLFLQEDPSRGQELLADLADKVCDVQTKIVRLGMKEHEGSLADASETLVH